MLARRSTTGNRRRSTRRSARSGSSSPSRSSSSGSGMLRAPGTCRRASLAGVADVDRAASVGELASRPASSVGGEPGAAPRPASGWSSERRIEVVELRRRRRSKPMRARRTLRLVLAARVGDEHDLAGRGGTTSPAYSAKRPSRPTLTDPRRWPAANVRRIAGVEHDGARPSAREHLVERRARRRGASSSSSVAALAVAVGGEREVQRRDRLALGHRVDELVLGHRRAARSWSARCSPIVDYGLGRQVLAARRAGAVGRDTPGWRRAG